MDSMKLFWGLIVLSLGGVLLSVNQGWLTSSIWTSIFALWPIILIAIGLKLLVTNEKLLSGLTIGLVLVAAIFVTLTYNPNGNNAIFGNWNMMGLRFNGQVYSESLTETYDATVTNNADITISTGAITLSVKELPAGTSVDTLYIIETKDMGKIAVTKIAEGDTLKLGIEETQAGMHIGGPVTDRKLYLYLTKSLILKLKIDSGASKVTLDYSKLRVENSDINIGASSGDIYLGDTVARQTLAIDAGASSLTFHVPKTLGINATFDGGLNTITSDSALNIIKTDNNYKSANFDTRLSQIIITGNTGVSSIKLQAN